MPENEIKLNRIIADNITLLMRMKNRTQLELAEYLGVTQATVSNWCNGVKMPRMDKLDKICEFLGVSRSALMTSPSSSSVTTAIRIPVFGRIPAGVPLEAIEDICGYEEMSAQLAESDKEYFALEIRGDSMYPKYMDGDIVIFERQSDCESGDDCAVRINGDDATFKKIRKKQFGITLQPINPDYEPIHIDYGDPDQPIEILGIAKEIRRKV